MLNPIAQLQQENDRLTAQCDLPRAVSFAYRLQTELAQLRQFESRDRPLVENAPDRATQERAKLLSTVAQVVNL